MAKAPDFSKATVETLAKRASQTCSNPKCRIATSGPHADSSKAVIVGQAAHIRGARPGSARFDPSMSDKERAAPSNGIWLCSDCAKRIDSDSATFTVDLLRRWKSEHEAWVEDGRPLSRAATRETTVEGGGLGSFISNEEAGTALEVTGAPGQTAERIHVQGRGIGEVIVNTGSGTAKKVQSSGAPVASESQVVVDQPVPMAGGCHSTLAFRVCDRCRNQFVASKIVHAFAGDQEPQVPVKCPSCGCITWV